LEQDFFVVLTFEKGGGSEHPLAVLCYMANNDIAAMRILLP